MPHPYPNLYFKDSYLMGEIYTIIKAHLIGKFV